MSRNLKWIYNAFNFLEVWLPYGRQSIVYEADGTFYTVETSSLEDEGSNQTLTGVDITIFHPEGKLVTPENFKDVVVGTCLGQTRKNGESYEVKCLIKDSTTIEMVRSNQLAETSAVYVPSSNGTRKYNSIAIVPEGFAKLGRQMQIKAESHNPEKIMLTPEDIKAIADAVTADFKAIESANEAMEQIRAEARSDGEAAGRIAGRYEAEVLTAAKSIGYEGSEATEATNHLIDTQFPGLRSESMGAGDISLLVQAAMKSMPTCKTCGEKTEAIETEEAEPIMAESIPMVNTVSGGTPPVARKVLPRRVI